MTQSANRHPWEISRMDQLTELILFEIKDRKQIVLADIGAGDLYFAHKLTEKLDREKISWTLHAVDTGYGEQVNEVWPMWADDRLVIHDNVDTLPDQSVDGLILLDVLEHVDDDHDFIGHLKLKLKPGGMMVVTVPAFQSLFSNHDLFLKHFRRYSLKDLTSLVSAHHFTITKAHYFYFSLFLVRLLSSGLEKFNRRFYQSWHHLATLQNWRREYKQTGIGNWQFQETSFLTRSLADCLNVDFTICRILDQIRLHVPGLSVLVIAHKMEL